MVIDPMIFVPRQAAIDMANEAHEHSDETGWGMYGLVFAETVIFVAGVLRPQPSDIIRKHARTRVGGPSMGNAIKWLRKNHRFAKEFFKSDHPRQIVPLFKGHSHHRLGVRQFSSKDHESIVEAVEVDNLDVAISPLALIESDRPTVKKNNRLEGTIVVSEHRRVLLRFYYFSKTMLSRGKRKAILVNPIILDDIPAGLFIPPVGWQYAHEAEYLEQIRHLRNYGCNVNVLQREITDGPPFEIQFVVERPDWIGTLSIVTAYDYPKTPPSVEVLLPEGESVCQQQFAHAPHLLEGPVWYKGDDFMDMVCRLMARGEL